VLEKIMKRILCYLRAALIARTDAIGPVGGKRRAKG
jgi:hypothetical protein